MRKLWIMLLGLAVLSGCTFGTGDSGVSADPQEPAVDSVSWGVMDLENAALTPQAEASMLEPDAESALEERGGEAAPSTSALPTTLLDVLPGKITVWVDGQALTGVLEDGVTLVSVSELQAIWPWFQGTGDGETWTYTGQADFPHEITCQRPEAYDGSGGICFQGIHEEYWLPVRWISQEIGARLLWDEEWGDIYLSAPVRVRDIPQGVQVPVLMYHAVSDDLWGIGELFVSPSELEKQLSYLQENGYDPIFFSDLPNLSDYDKPVLLTFDDGYENNYTELLPLLEKYDTKATVFVITGLLETENYLTVEQVKALSDSDVVDIQSHTVHHNELPTLSREDQEYQLTQSQLELARITGKIPYVLCYPTGKRNDTTVELTQSYYSFGVDMNGGLWTTADNYYRVPRIYISREDTLSSFAAKLP